jgi:hypothetical protein
LAVLFAFGARHVFDGLQDDRGSEPAVAVELSAIGGLSVFGHELPSF